MPKFILLFFFSTCCLSTFSQEQDTFNLCDDQKIYPYYHPDLIYNGGFWIIKTHFEENYPTQKMQTLSNNSGILTIQFKVNCKGQAGNYTVLQCDLSYQATILHPEIVHYFLTKTQQLQDWIPAKDENGNVVNSHKFFSFKIRNGLLIEVLPK